ncbi:MAG: bifunctional molybdenum cofactor biosynthesis protein MoaC/MoaB [Cytophagales bacterium]|nr:bifunctional molybdenum cofactor biosynthesis protein MoaC/MoaB [Cytophagales bacterium]
MRDISSKIKTLRIARASAMMKMSGDSIDAIKNNATPKKDVLAIARAAGYLAVKNTGNTIPHCHPLPIEAVNIAYDLKDDTVRIDVEVKTCYKTGCEMEALHGASVVALTIYDMIKPIDKNIEISTIKLEEKSGGKSDFKDRFPGSLQAAVIVVSDSVAAGSKHDKAGKSIIKKLETFDIVINDYIIIPDEPGEIRKNVEKYCEQEIDIVITTGGTGLSPRDHTPESLKPLIDTEIPGIMEAARSYGQNRTPYAMLSRSIAGLKNRTLILALPGSSRGAAETMDALFPNVLHIFKVLEKGYRHELEGTKSHNKGL